MPVAVGAQRPSNLRRAFISGLTARAPFLGKLADLAIPDPMTDPTLGMLSPLGMATEGGALSLSRVLASAKRLGYPEASNIRRGILHTTGKKLDLDVKDFPSHVEAATKLIGGKAKGTQGVEDLLGSDWIRKAAPGSYSLGALTPKHIAALEDDIFSDAARYEKAMRPEIRLDVFPGAGRGGIKYADSKYYRLDLDDILNNGLEEAIARSKAGRIR